MDRTHSLNRPTLGVVAISFNEKQDMPGFLDHLVEWVDEIVIVDDGSTDTTRELCANAGPKVHFMEAKRSDGEYFSHQRNKGIAAAKSDWLLHMDIDERVTPELSDEIQTAIGRSDIDGYRFRRLNYFMHRPMRGGGWQDWNLIHLARREKFHFGGMFHESCHLEAPDARVGQLENRMHHFNEDSFEKRLRKSHVYMEEVIAGIEDRSKKVNGASILMATLKEFLKKYFYKKGFLDGTPGMISAIHSATAIFRAYSVVWSRQNLVDREALEMEFKNKWRNSKHGKSG